MKKLIGVISLLLSLSSFGQDKNIISFDVGDIVNQKGNFNTNLVFNNYSKHDDLEGNSKSFLFNYSRVLSSHFQVRLLLGYSSSETLTDATDDLYEEMSMKTYGLGLVYNFSEKTSHSWFVGLNYIIQSVNYSKEFAVAANDFDESGSAKTILFEVGKRFRLFSYSGMNLSWAPSISYLKSTYDEEISGAFGGIDDSSEIKVNLLRLDALF